MDLPLVVGLAALIVAIASMAVGAGAAVRVAEIQRYLSTMGQGSGPAGLRTGSAVPQVVGADIEGRPVDWATLRRGPTLLIRGSPDCPPCNDLLGALPSFQSRHPEWATVLLTTGREDVVRERYGQLPAVVMRLETTPSAEGFTAAMTPYVFILIDGHIRHQGGANTVDHLERLIERALQRDPAHTSAA